MTMSKFVVCKYYRPGQICPKPVEFIGDVRFFAPCPFVTKIGKASIKQLRCLFYKQKQ